LINKAGIVLKIPLMLKSVWAVMIETIFTDKRLSGSGFAYK